MLAFVFKLLCMRQTMVRCDRVGSFAIADDALRRSFGSLGAVVAAHNTVALHVSVICCYYCYYHFSIRKALRDALHTNELWFHGDLSSAEAAELLAPNVVGSFLLRFRFGWCW